MKPSLILLILASLAVLPCLAQTPPPQPPPPGQRFQNAIEQMQGMSPAQQAEFLQNHPRLQQFLNNHPNVAKGISSGSEAGAGVRDPGHPRVNEVNQREQNLDQRVNQGVASGTLNSQQAANIDQKVQGIQQQEAKDMAGDNGHLTRAEDRQLNHEENQLSRQIHRDKKGKKGGGGGASGAQANP